ncbi:hypothetical protein CYMTET_53289 [Cymbomonas tetramitiformis]|uniref:Uncharacterized protein n=1 Tax=Cymbomonas tetramitiformis TaxID=36881 RepID=A0AAE0ERV9_9CHLO|nr:hypothetical protein CYMTET_53289 [Cymbomonas tetramitiformis]
MVAQPAWGHAAALTAPRAQLHQQHADVDKRQTAATTEPGAAVVTSCGHQDIRKLPAEPPSCVAGAAITRDGKHQKVGYGCACCGHTEISMHQLATRRPAALHPLVHLCRWVGDGGPANTSRRQAYCWIGAGATAHGVAGDRGDGEPWARQRQFRQVATAAVAPAASRVVSTSSRVSKR